MHQAKGIQCAAAFIPCRRAKPEVSRSHAQVRAPQTLLWQWDAAAEVIEPVDDHMQLVVRTALRPGRGLDRINKVSFEDQASRRSLTFRSLSRASCFLRNRFSATSAERLLIKERMRFSKGQFYTYRRPETSSRFNMFASGLSFCGRQFMLGLRRTSGIPGMTGRATHAVLTFGSKSRVAMSILADFWRDRSRSS
jgi:hypothetical protein